MHEDTVNDAEAAKTTTTTKTKLQVDYYENFNLESIVVPVNVQRLHSLLSHYGYCHKETAFLVDGFTNGFTIGYKGDEKVKITTPNLKFRGVDNHIILWNKVMKEVKAKRYAGPFKSIPFEYYIQSPIGLVPKDNGTD